MPQTEILTFLTFLTATIPIISSIVAVGFRLEKRNKIRMARYDRLKETYKRIAELESNNNMGYNTTSIIKMPHPSNNCLNPPKPEVTEYKILGSPDIYAKLYHKTNHIIKTAKDYDIEKIKDIRQADLDGKFGFPNRYRQIRDLM